MNHAATSWSQDHFCLSTAGVAGCECVADLAEEVYRRVCRVDFTAPGFCLIDLGRAIDSRKLREAMVSLKQALDALHRRETGRQLNYVSAGRFDQQETTKPHRDGGPDESMLMLGYEPTDVPAEVVITDYAKCAHERNLTPAEMLERHNPMFPAGVAMLEPYATRVSCFSRDSNQLLLINNSVVPYSPESHAWQGVLHTAAILAPAAEKRRVVNSTMIASVAAGTPEPVSAAEQAEFVSTSVVRRRGYDKTELTDDG